MRPDADAGSDDVAYVIYTSGSTGQPKGVRVPHRASSTSSPACAAAGLTAAPDVLAVTTLSFDIAVSELLLPLDRRRDGRGRRDAATDGDRCAGCSRRAARRHAGHAGDLAHAARGRLARPSGI